jgi:TDG/mug DNA glycosylase family protein
MERRHGLPSIIGQNPCVLILGSFPSVMSLERKEYYGNPRNQFWPLMEALVGIDSDLPYQERAAALTERRIALWDVIESCTRAGSGDAAIRDPVGNDVPQLLSRHPTILHIALNGKTGAGRWFRRLFPELIHQKNISVAAYPSTSPAMARYSFAKKAQAWEAILAYIP